MPYFALLSAIAFIGLALLACTGRTRRFESLPGEAVAFVAVPSDTYVELDPEDLAALWPSIRRFELDPTTLRLRVGQDYPLRALRVIAVDSSGARIGQIAQLEYALASDVARITPERTLRALRVGETTLTLRLRRASALEQFEPLPEWQARILVDLARKG